ncbi:hypothetical protein B7C42_05050 [Nocardia cerradoensis]|uniref:SnoaL-like domain-containing protein n=1 Tax=Nocardia cerradoensis TaxID=85688 RepID=A0A231H1I5_9NOCA|nr:hypothetical protein [Nocardia cerradoensis]OXR42713.1 hypothetical protein B7C42_05050 [Nocardia cerradoensis]
MSYEPTDIELKNLLDHWIGQWNEPDADRRRELIREVWAEDGYQILVNPPEGIRDTARQYGVPAPAVEVRGYDAMFARVTRAYEMFVADGEHFFEAEGEPVRHAGAAVALTWVMRSRADGTVAGSGLEVLTFDPDGRVRTDHEFVN